MSGKIRRETRMSDQAVEAKTGRIWADWFTILDDWDSASKEHKSTARYLAEKHGLSPWWSQTVTVEYERERGLREVGEREGQFVATVQRTIRATPEEIYSALTRPEALTSWFTKEASVDLRVGGNYENSDGDTGKFLVIEPPARLRFTWENPEHSPGSEVEATIHPKTANKSTLRLEHSKLKSREEFEDMKEGWSWALDSLKSFLERGTAISFEEWGEGN